ncbi:gluconokinase [Saccharibacillus kuerlensis]|uniref:Gluconate kinase n=1 Tax=Saccharibacillus kuerlensis TaxID=459527 RepID=A0ABQ2KU50_9BACL|nr:gluconokinase [Saccharibacillus kuerlensis]GGN93471.1 gluconate kinase [Saccharibacillus kuerlensis]
MGLYIGLDIGTTSTKAFLYDEKGSIRGGSQAAYPLLVPEAGRAEQRPEALLDAVCDAIAGAMHDAGAAKGEISAVGISAAMHSLMAVDGKGNPLTPLITWADNRSIRQANELRRGAEGERLYRATGTPIHPMSPLTKLLWLRSREPKLFEQAAKFISFKEYLLHKLFGRYALDVSIASATGMLDLNTLTWNQSTLQLTSLAPERLGEIVPITERFEGMDRMLAERMGLHPDTPWIAGASDGALANVGVGALERGETAVTIGTSGAVRSFAKHPVTDVEGRTFCYAFEPERWLIGGPTNNGGIALRWYLEQFVIDKEEGETGDLKEKEALDRIVQLADSVPPGSEGLLFLPYLSGERAPYWNADARGTYFGATLHHGRAHFGRATMEGVLFAVRTVADALETLGGESQTLWASGGFAKSEIWTQMLADLSGTRVVVPDTYEASAFGAAAVAMKADGAISDYQDLKAGIEILRTHEPDLQRFYTYEHYYSLFKRVYKQLEPVFPEIAKLQRGTGVKHEDESGDDVLFPSPEESNES